VHLNVSCDGPNGEHLKKHEMYSLLLSVYRRMYHRLNCINIKNLHLKLNGYGYIDAKILWFHILYLIIVMCHPYTTQAHP